MFEAPNLNSMFQSKYTFVQWRLSLPCDIVQSAGVAFRARSDHVIEFLVLFSVSLAPSSVVGGASIKATWLYDAKGDGWRITDGFPCSNDLFNHRTTA